MSVDNLKAFFFITFITIYLLGQCVEVLQINEDFCIELIHRFYLLVSNDSSIFSIADSIHRYIPDNLYVS